MTKGVLSYGHRYDSSIEIGHLYAPDTSTPIIPDATRFEDGHPFYVFEQPTEYHGRVARIARSFSQNAIILGLLDDVAIEDSRAKHLSGDSLFETLPVDDVYEESDYVDAANDLIARIRAIALPEGYRLNEDKTKLIIGSGKDRQYISLVGFKGIDDPAHPSCEVLDLAWTLDRLQTIAPTAATILPDSYRGQQARVALLAGLIPETQGYNVTSIFVDDRGNETDREKWAL